MTQYHQNLTEALAARTFLKVIAGIDNFDLQSVADMADAAQQGGAHALDIAADPALIRSVRSRYPGLVLFVSSLAPDRLAAAARDGADVLELGNFDALYRQSRTVSVAEALGWTREVRRVLPEGALLCATVPGCLPAAAQLQSAIDLQAAGANILQLEGCHDLALAAATFIVQTVKIPVFISGGVTLTDIPAIRRTGVQGIGVGHAVRKAGEVSDMARLVSEFSLALQNPIGDLRPMAASCRNS